ncbi:MAG TPA: hypothetical protein VKA08_03865 [Balneolales bacterium]|nr:hypothetical protein [Balneolales bacterium]
MSESKQTATRFLELIRRSQRGKLKVYLGMAPGVGKTYRMLQEAHQLLAQGVDICVGLVETHKREDITQLLGGLPVLPRKELFYRGKKLEEMDVDAVLLRKPEIALVDELAHTNAPGSRNEKRWQDVDELIASGINVISTVNIQHLESIHEEIRSITGIDVKERIPDAVLQRADEIVNVDLTTDELIQRLKEGKVYHPSRVGAALAHFFQPDNLVQLRELTLREATRLVSRQAEIVVTPNRRLPIEGIATCVSSNSKTGPYLIRASSRLANTAQSRWYVIYVETPRESVDRIPLESQRGLMHTLELGAQMGAEIIRLQQTDIAKAIIDFTIEKRINWIVIGRPYSSWWRRLLHKDVLSNLIRSTINTSINLQIISTYDRS